MSIRGGMFFLFAAAVNAVAVVPDIQFSFNKDVVTLLLDTSGAGLHKRGYRPQSNAAPIKETAVYNKGLYDVRVEESTDNSIVISSTKEADATVAFPIGYGYDYVQILDYPALYTTATNIYSGNIAAFLFAIISISFS